jgi:16S rRNA (adenine1518-N6/adenine1519-N6)-dimethyltransferase
VVAGRVTDGSGELLGAREIRDLAERLGVRPTKRLGQNFVIDPNTVQRIVRAADLDDGACVLEVGPGLGSLTLALLQQGHDVVAVEIDPVLAAQLPVTVAEHQPGNAHRLTVIEADALRLDGLLIGAPDRPVDALVANLPYNVAVPVLLTLLEQLPSLTSALVMVQKEVAERLAADPGSKVYGVPSVKARWYGEVTYAGNVSPHVFWPEPNVDSGLVRVERVQRPEWRTSRACVFSVVDAAFAQRRKSLRGALAGLVGSAAASELALLEAGIDPRTRGEELALVDFVRLADAIFRDATGPTSLRNE